MPDQCGQLVPPPKPSAASKPSKKLSTPQRPAKSSPGIRRSNTISTPARPPPPKVAGTKHADTPPRPQFPKRPPPPQKSELTVEGPVGSGLGSKPIRKSVKSKRAPPPPTVAAAPRTSVAPAPASATAEAAGDQGSATASNTLPVANSVNLKPVENPYDDVIDTIPPPDPLPPLPPPPEAPPDDEEALPPPPPPVDMTPAPAPDESEKAENDVLGRLPRPITMLLTSSDPDMSDVPPPPPQEPEE